MMKKAVLAAMTLACSVSPALALDKVRVISSTKLFFENDLPYTGVETDIFRRNGLDVSIIHGDGGASSLQTVITGSQDIVWANGTLGVVTAYSRGAPIRILGSTIRGLGDLFWYVKADSTIKSLRDLKPTDQFTYSRPGSTTDLATIGIMKSLGINPKKVSVGGPSASLTQLMSGQVTTGWSLFPLHKGLVNQGKIRIIGTGTEAKDLNEVTIRVVAANSTWLETNRDVAKRFMIAMEEAIKLAYRSVERQQAWAKRWKLNYDDVKTVVEEIPYEWTTLTPVASIEKVNQIAVETKKLKAPLTAEQIKELVHLMGNKP